MRPNECSSLFKVRRKLSVARWALVAMVTVLGAVTIIASGGGGGGGMGDIPAFTMQDGLAVVDLNGDGRMDVLQATTYISGSPPHPGTLVVYTQSASHPGTYVRSGGYAVAGDPWHISIGDVNGDGLPDAAVVGTTTNLISVLLQNPLQRGVFFTAEHYTCGPQPYSVAMGDLNGDGLVDLAVVVGAPGGVAVLFQDKENPGKFLPAVNMNIGAAGGSVAIADLNGDGRADMVVAASHLNSIVVLIQDPLHAGTFLPAVTYGAGLQPISVIAADLDGDGLSDLVVANMGSQEGGFGAAISVLLQDPAQRGVFFPARNYTVPNGARAVAAGDLNGDGRPDLVVVSQPAATSSTVSIFLQDGAQPRTFVAQPGYVAGDSLSDFIALGDLNGDGRLDIIINGPTDGRPVVFFQNPALPGRFFGALALP
jgi:hypothetical protein